MVTKEFTPFEMMDLEGRARLPDCANYALVGTPMSDILSNKYNEKESQVTPCSYAPQKKNQT